VPTRRPAPLRSLPTPLLAFALLWALPALAQPPVSDADRDAARNLFKEGYDLQLAGNYAEALDRFRRSQQVTPAPTALLHIAECQAQLLHLVEAAETYRALAHQPIADGSPPAFVAAQTQGAAELQQIEPRIPHVRVEVRPADVPNLEVFIDGQPMNTALVGVDRAIDPGEHKISAVAPGYDRTEAVVRFAEKEPPRAVPLVLTPTPGVFVPAAPATAVAPAPPPRVVYVTQPAPRTGYVMAPRTYYPATPPPPPAPPQSRTGLFFGLRGGALVPSGNDVRSAISTGGSIGAELDVRFARRYFAGVILDHGFLGTSSSFGSGASGPSGASGTGDASGPSPTFSTTNVDAVFGFVTSPDHLAFLIETGLGYRVLGASSGPTALDSGEFLLGAGMWIPAGSRLRIVPRVDMTVGSFSGTDWNGTTSVAYGYAMFMLGVGGYYNVDFH